MSLNSVGTIEDSLRVRHNPRHMTSNKSGELDGLKIAIMSFLEGSQKLRARFAWLAKDTAASQILSV